MKRFVAGLLLSFAGSSCFMACGAPSEEEPLGSVAEPMVILKPPKHFSGEPEYPVEGAPKLDLPPPWVVEPSDPGPDHEPYEPPTYEPPAYEPPEPDHHNGVDPYEHRNPHHESTGNHGGLDVGGSSDDTHPSPKLGTVKCNSPNECVWRSASTKASRAMRPSRRTPTRGITFASAGGSRVAVSTPAAVGRSVTTSIRTGIFAPFGTTRPGRRRVATMADTMADTIIRIERRYFDAGDG